MITQNINNYKNITNTTGLTKDTPFIKNLIDKRIYFCQLGSSSHIAAFLSVSLDSQYHFIQYRGNGTAVIGENSHKPLYSNSKIMTHAEMEALKKVKGLLRCGKLKKNKKNKMNLIVLRINKSGQLCESAPCYHCSKELAKDSFIKINKLYFSRNDGTITCIKFDDWINNGNFHVSKGWKRLKKKIFD